MNQKELLNNLISRRLPDIEKSGNLMESVVALHAVLEKQLAFYSDLNDLFIKHETGNLFLSCPECKSPTLLEFKNCSLCGTVLMEDTDKLVVEEVKEEKEEKPAKKTKKKQTKKTKKTKVVEAPPLNEIELDLDEPELELEEPKKKKQKVIVEFDTNEFPTEDEIDAMKAVELKKVIKEFNLLVDPKGLKVSELREAVNKVIDALCDPDEPEDDEPEDLNNEDLGEEVEEEEEEEEIETTEEDLDAFDLDGMDFDGEDEIDDLDEID